MAKYRKKPVVVEAIQFTGENFAEIQKLTDGQFLPIAVNDRIDDPEITGQVFDYLHSTWIGVKPNQWIIKGTKGEFYPCATETFDEIYEKVD